MFVQACVLSYLRICESACDGCKDDYHTHRAQLPIQKGPLQEFEAGEGGQDDFLFSLVKMGGLAILRLFVNGDAKTFFRFFFIHFFICI